MLENFLDGFKGAEWSMNNIKSKQWKNFKKITCPSFTSHLQKGTLGFSIYLNSRKKMVANTCFKNVILILIHQLRKIIKNIIFRKKIKLKYACASALCVDHAHIVCFWNYTF